MVTRTYNAPEFNVQDNRQFRTSEVQGADTRASAPLVIGDSAWRDNLLISLGGTASKLLDKAADFEFSNQYLEGQAQAGIAESEDELQGNPLTRDWKVAGYRDTMGKLALADNEAQFQLDLPKLREGNAEDVQKYLSTRRAKLLPGISSMSREARASAAGQLLLQDRAATKTWVGEHAKYIIETKGQAVATTWQTSLSSLEATQMRVATGEASMDTLQEQLRNSVGNVVGNVWMDSSLPKDVQQEWTFNMVQQALSKDNVALYDYVAANDIADGTGGSLIGRLSSEQQIKLSNQYREAMSRTNDQRSLARMEQIATFESSVDAGVYTGTFEDVQDTFRPMVLNKTITGERYQALVNKYLDKSYQAEQDSGLGEALLRGDANYISNSGKSTDDAITAFDRLMGKRKLPAEQKLNAWLAIGQAGTPQGYKKAGEILGTSIRQIMDSKTGEVLPQHAAVFRQISATVDRLDGEGQTLSRVHLLSGMSEDDRMFTEQIMRRTGPGGGATLEEAITKARELAVNDAALTPSMKAARSQGVAKGVAEAISSVEPMGMLENAWGYGAKIFSAEAEAKWKIQPNSYMNWRDGVFSDGPTVKFYTDRTRTALANEASDVAFLQPSATADEVMSVAYANVAARTISTSHGPIMMPRNVNLGTVFGVGAGNQAAIGKAIDGMLNETKADTNFQMNFQQGRLFVQEVDRHGVRVGSGMYLNPADVKARIKADTNVDFEKANQRMGSGRIRKADELPPPNAPEQGTKQSASGKIRKADSGLEVQYNGINTAGVPTDWAFDFRDNLVNHEGVRSKPYKDLGGGKMKDGTPIMTVGVGVSSHNTRFPKVQPDGTVSKEDINKSFMDASNDAAVAGNRVAKDLGITNKAGFMLMSELAYQSGAGFITQQDKHGTGHAYRLFGKAMLQGTVEEAQAAFKSTAAWRYSKDSKNPDKLTARQKNYLKLIEESMKG